MYVAGVYIVYGSMGLYILTYMLVVVMPLH